MKQSSKTGQLLRPIEADLATARAASPPSDQQRPFGPPASTSSAAVARRPW